MGYKIVGIGEILWDVFSQGKRLGGAPSNFAYHVSSLGFSAVVISAVGNDEPGDEIIATFRDKPFLTNVQRVDFPTGRADIILNDRGVPEYDIRQGVAWDNIDFNAELESLANECSAVVFGSLSQRSEKSRETILRFIDSITNKDAYKIFDINLRQNFYTKDILDNSLDRCNILKINEDEMYILAELYGLNSSEFNDICRKLMMLYRINIVILTCGENGSYIFAGESVSYLPTPKIRVVDTVGAGDSFTAAFCATMLSTHFSIEDAHLFAVNFSAYVCTQRGAMPSIPDEFKTKI